MNIWSFSAVFPFILSVSSIQIDSAGERANRICGQPPERGLCRALIIKWFFNSWTSQCEQFVWGGCYFRNNRNIFNTQNDCQSFCGKSNPKPYATTTPPPKATINPNVPDKCRQKNVAGTRCPGTGFTMLVKYFFNVDKGFCQPMMYLGCGGNENKFKDKQECFNECEIYNLAEDGSLPEVYTAPAGTNLMQIIWKSGVVGRYKIENQNMCWEKFLTSKNPSTTDECKELCNQYEDCNGFIYHDDQKYYIGGGFCRVVSGSYPCNDKRIGEIFWVRVGEEESRND